MAERPDTHSTSHALVTPMRAFVVLLLLSGALYIRFAPFGTPRQIPAHFNTPEELKIVWSKPVLSQAISMRFSPDGKYLISSGGELKGKISRYKNGQYLFDFKVRDKRLSLWNVAQKTRVEKLKAEAIFGGWNGEHMFIMPDFRTLITGSHFGGLKVIDVHKKRPDKIIRTKTGTVCSLRVSPDEKVLAVGTIGGVEFFNARNLRPLKTYEHYGGNFGANVYFSRDSKTIKCMWDGSRNPHYIDVKTGKRIKTSQFKEDQWREYSPNGHYFVEVKNRNLLEVWQRGDKQNHKIQTFPTSFFFIYATQFSPDGKTLAVGGLSATQDPVQFYQLSNIRKQYKAL